MLVGVDVTACVCVTVGVGVGVSVGVCVADAVSVTVADSASDPSLCAYVSLYLRKDRATSAASTAAKMRTCTTFAVTVPIKCFNFGVS